MKTLGLLGGMSWESTATYYRMINERVRSHMGGLHSAQMLMYSFDMQIIADLQMQGKWDEAGALLAAAAKTLSDAGADQLVLCTNTMHVLAEHIHAATDTPLLHITDSTIAAIKAQGLSCVTLLGTAFTMEKRFYIERLEAEGITVIVPDDDARKTVHSIIYNELCKGVVRDASRARCCEIIDACAAKGAQGVILGCTEIGMLIAPDATHPWPVFDTTQLHAHRAADVMMECADYYEAA